MVDTEVVLDCTSMVATDGKSRNLQPMAGADTECAALYSIAYESKMTNE